MPIGVCSPETWFAQIPIGICCFFLVCPNTNWYLLARNLVCPNTSWYLLFFFRFAQIPVGIYSPETWFASAQLGQARLKLGLPLPSLGKPA